MRQNANALRAMLYNWLGKKCQRRWERSIDLVDPDYRLTLRRKTQGWSPNINREEYQDKRLVASLFNIIFIIDSNVKIKRCQLYLSAREKETLFSVFKIKITLDIDSLLIMINGYRVNSKTQTCAHQ